MHDPRHRIERTRSLQLLKEETIQQFHLIGKAFRITETLIKRGDPRPVKPHGLQRHRQ